MTQVTFNPKTPTPWEKQQAKNAHHRALISQIIHAHPGLTTQQIIQKEEEMYGYQFLTDNRLREMRKSGWVESRQGEDNLLRWYPKEETQRISKMRERERE